MLRCTHATGFYEGKSPSRMSHCTHGASAGSSRQPACPRREEIARSRSPRSRSSFTGKIGNFFATVGPDLSAPRRPRRLQAVDALCALPGISHEHREQYRKNFSRPRRLLGHRQPGALVAGRHGTHRPIPLRPGRGDGARRAVPLVDLGCRGLANRHPRGAGFPRRLSRSGRRGLLRQPAGGQALHPAAGARAGHRALPVAAHRRQYRAGATRDRTSAPVAAHPHGHRPHGHRAFPRPELPAGCHGRPGLPVRPDPLWRHVFRAAVSRSRRHQPAPGRPGLPGRACRGLAAFAAARAARARPHPGNRAHPCAHRHCGRHGHRPAAGPRLAPAALAGQSGHRAGPGCFRRPGRVGRGFDPRVGPGRTAAAGARAGYRRCHAQAAVRGGARPAGAHAGRGLRHCRGQR